MFIKITVLAILVGFIAFGILSLTQFKADIRENSKERLAIDLGENLLSAPCLADMKGVFNETKLKQQECYAKYGNTVNELDRISCIDSLLASVITISTQDKSWDFGVKNMRTGRIPPAVKADSPEYEFPALVRMEDGSTEPAKLVIKYAPSGNCGYGYKGADCYNCIKKEECEKMGCKWNGDYCRPAYSCTEICKQDDVCNPKCGSNGCKPDIDCCLVLGKRLSYGDTVFSGTCNSKNYEVFYNASSDISVLIEVRENGETVMEGIDKYHEIEKGKTITVNNIKITAKNIIGKKAIIEAGCA